MEVDVAEARPAQRPVFGVGPDPDSAALPMELGTPRPAATGAGPTGVTAVGSSFAAAVDGVLDEVASSGRSDSDMSAGRESTRWVPQVRPTAGCMGLHMRCSASV